MSGEKVVSTFSWHDQEVVGVGLPVKRLRRENGAQQKLHPCHGALTHLFKVEKPTFRSSATWPRESPLVSAIRTASLRNSSVLPVPMVHLLCCTVGDQRSGTKP